MEARRGQAPLPSGFDHAALNDWLNSWQQSRGASQAGSGYSNLPGLSGQASQLGVGPSYLGLDPGLPSVGVNAAPSYQPYAPFETSVATERQLTDLFPNQIDLSSYSGLAHADAYHAAFPDEPLFGGGPEAGQEGEEKPRSKMQEKNRRAQRRFRERQKAKFTELTGKVEELEGRLSEVLSEKARLEDRTSILEKTLEMRRASSLDGEEDSARRLNSVELGEGTSQTSTYSSPRADLRVRAAAPLGTASDDLAEGSVRFFHDDLHLSLPINGKYTLSLEALKNTSPRDIICLYEQYVQELSSCLHMEAADQPFTPAAARVVKLANDISTLMLRAWALNPVTMRQLYQHLSAHGEEEDVKETAEMHRIASCLRLTEEQSAKLVSAYTRFKQQREVLLAQRQGIYARLQRSSDSRTVRDSILEEFLKVHDAMNMLKINLRQEHWESLSFGSTCVQLLTPWQMATFLVESYPQWYDFLALSNALAEGREARTEPAP